MTDAQDPIAILHHEHEFIKKVVGTLGAIAERLAAGQRIDPERLRGIVRFMQEFADRCHPKREYSREAGRGDRPDAHALHKPHLERRRDGVPDG